MVGAIQAAKDQGMKKGDRVIVLLADSTRNYMTKVTTMLVLVLLLVLLLLVVVTVLVLLLVLTLVLTLSFSLSQFLSDAWMESNGHASDVYKPVAEIAELKTRSKDLSKLTCDDSWRTMV